MSSFNTANYFVSCTCRAQTHPDHMPLHKVEDLFNGDRVMISCLCMLLFKRWTRAAKANLNDPSLQKLLGIINRHGIMEVKDQLNPDLQNYLEQVKDVQYNPEKDKQIADHFGPIGKGCLTIPDDANLHFIGSEADIPLLDRLIGVPLIGMDSEWRPTVRPFVEQRLAIFQLSSETDSYVIDLVNLVNNQVLDQKLTEIFTDERSLCLGFAFGSDTSMFKESLPEMQFFKMFKRFLDCQTYWQAIKKEKNQIGLAKVVEQIFGKPLCKGEQMSNWELRPLRQT